MRYSLLMTAAISLTVIGLVKKVGERVGAGAKIEQ